MDGQLNIQSLCWDVNLIDYVVKFHVAFFMAASYLGFYDYCGVLFMSINPNPLHYSSNWMNDANVTFYITPDIILSLCVSLNFVLYDTSHQGEASQYSPAGGRLWDQKRVLPLPWTVSSDVLLAGGKGFLLVFAVARASWTLCVDYTLVGNELL